MTSCGNIILLLKLNLHCLPVDTVHVQGSGGQYVTVLNLDAMPHIYAEYRQAGGTSSPLIHVSISRD